MTSCHPLDGFGMHGMWWRDDEQRPLGCEENYGVNRFGDALVGLAWMPFNTALMGRMPIGNVCYLMLRKGLRRWPHNC